MAKTENENNFLKAVKNIISNDNKKRNAANIADAVLKEAVQVFSKLNQPYAVITQNSKIVYANNAFIDLLGTAVLPHGVQDMTNKADYTLFSKKAEDVFCF